LAGFPDGVEEVARGVYLVDAWQFGRPRCGGVYVVQGEEAALVESGTSLAADRILRALSALGIGRTEVCWLFLTHIHLDHAGGAGALLPHLPRARVVVHPRGARHLVDPGRLLESVKAAVGNRFPLYGTAVPIPEDRLYVSEDGERFELGGRVIRAIDSPGHAPHHLCFFEERGKLLFTGDAAGLWLSGRLIPATPPPSFDLAVSLATLEKLSALGPRLILYTHYGPREDGGSLAEYARLLSWWVERVQRALDGASGDEAKAVEALVSELAGEGWPVDDPGVREDLIMSARGAISYLKRREAGQA